MKWFFLSVLALVMTACFEQGNCSDVSGNVMQVNFYSNSNKQALTIALDSVKMVGSDTVMHKAKSLDNVNLPIDPGATSMTYIFYYNNTQAQLDIQYDFKSFALAPECNAIDLITLNDATGITIQNLTIIQPKLTNTVAENIKLYF